MTRMTRDEHDRLRVLIELMQRDGRTEAAIHEAVRRATGDGRPPRRQGRRNVLGRVFGRRSSRA